MRILVVCIFIHQFASLTVLRRRHCVAGDKRETTFGRQLVTVRAEHPLALF
jgi:hypothetical protein